MLFRIVGNGIKFSNEEPSECCVGEYLSQLVRCNIIIVVETLVRFLACEREERQCVRDRRPWGLVSSGM